MEKKVGGTAERNRKGKLLERFESQQKKETVDGL